jgi:hypothetical protein
LYCYTQVPCITHRTRRENEVFSSCSRGDELFRLFRWFQRDLFVVVLAAFEIVIKKLSFALDLRHNIVHAIRAIVHCILKGSSIFHRIVHVVVASFTYLTTQFYILCRNS